MYVPTDEQFWSKEDPTKPDIAFLKNHFYREGRLTEEQALYILQKCVVLFYVLCCSRPRTGMKGGERELHAAQRVERDNMKRD